MPGTPEGSIKFITLRHLMSISLDEFEKYNRPYTPFMDSQKL